MNSAEFNTKDLNSLNGEYTRQRLFVHDDILQESLASIQPAKEQPLVIFLGGGSASGKSSISNMLLQTFKDDGESVALIDSDKIKTMLPEHNQLIKRSPEQAASILHDESSDISEKLYQAALKNKVNIIFDGTMKNPEKYEVLIQSAKAENYNVSLVLADVPLQEAIRRAEIRFEIEQRRVPPEIIEQSHKSVPNSFYRLKDQADSFYLYDTTHRHPELFYAKDEGKILVHNKERLEQFYNKGEVLPLKERWVELVEPKKLINILKSETKGVPNGDHITKELLNQKVNAYRLEVKKGIETLYLRGENVPERIELQRHPWLPQQNKNLLLDQIGINPPMSLKNDMSLDM